MWIRDVNIPAELIGAARNSRLVVFVGAGASLDAPAGLPSFTTLVRNVGTRAGTPPSEDDLRRPDVFLGRLTDDGIDVHGLVAKAIDLPESRPNRLHRAIVELARVHSPIRIVTTNYDQHLTSAARDAGVSPAIFQAPALPVGDDFEGLVHLHGALGQEARRLIVTDTDFGRAYLREAWAARFLERMFSAYTVLFIGYSHSDVVMQYLARSLGRGGTRFILTHDGDLPAWKSLGLTPIEYRLQGNSHDALPETLERWAELASLGATGHRQRIAEILSAGSLTIPEEISYLEESLGDPHRVQYFVEAARGPAWLSWAATRLEFDRLFLDQPEDDGGSPSVTAALATWVADCYAMVESESAAALRVMRSKSWTPSTWLTIVHRLFAQDGGVLDWQTPWLVLALHQSPLGRTELLDMLLARESWRARPDLAMLILEHRTRPIPVSELDFGETNDLPYFDIALAGDEHWLTEAWTKVFTPILNDHAKELLDLVVGQLRAAYQMLEALRPGSSTDALSFRRSAIEPHPQDDIRDSVDVLIDAARDCVERLLMVDPSAASSQFEEWTRADRALLRRLAVHGWRVRTDCETDDKLRWVCDENLLYDLDLQHEVFVLLEDVVPQASADRVQAVLDQVLAGPPTLEGEEQSPYRRYNLLVWLARVAPDSQTIGDAFRIAQTTHPEFAPRDHPDLNVYTESGEVEDAQPFTADELHTKIGQNPADALEEVRSYYTDDAFLALTGPTWRGALKSVRGCVTTYPRDGLLLAEVLQTADVDLRTTLIDAWSDTDLDDGLVTAIVNIIRDWNADEIRSTAARMFAHGGSGNHPTAWHRHQSAQELASRLWPDHQVAGNIAGSDDLQLEAMNHPAGDLAQFWTKVIAYEWGRDQNHWTGIPAEPARNLDTMLAADGRNGLLARTNLGGHLHFYFSADSVWTSARLLPLFDWESHPDDAPAVWQGFLSQGRPDDGLLEAGLLKNYLQTCTRTDQLGHERASNQLVAHLASITMSASAEPRTWLSDFIRQAPEPVREAWTRSIARRLRSLTAEESEQQWGRWIHEYWTDRIDSVPRPLTLAESSGMAEWVLGLPTRRTEAVELVTQVPAGLSEHGQLLHDLVTDQLGADPITWTRLLTHILRGTSTPSWEVDYYLKDIVRALKATEPPPDTSNLIEEAMRLGCTDAPDW